jgi:hypothetical protein
VVSIVRPLTAPFELPESISSLTTVETPSETVEEVVDLAPEINEEAVDLTPEAFDLPLVIPEELQQAAPPATAEIARPTTPNAAPPPAVAAPVATPGPWSVSASASTVNLAGQKNLRIQAVVGNRKPTRGAVYVEVYDPSGSRAHRAAFNNLFMAPGSHKFQFVWAIPPNSLPGDYRISIGIFSPEWDTLYYWEDSAASLQVSNGPR